MQTLGEGGFGRLDEFLKEVGGANRQGP
jgi:hypothetical protein